MKIILASKSPRRRELLATLVPEFEILTAETDETLPEGLHPAEGVRILAERKGAAVADSAPEDALIISSDTLVELDGVALGKPETEEDARRMLRSLSGRGHNVHTGIAVRYRGVVFSDTASTRVIFRDMSDGEIGDYILTGEPMDNAGAYGIQGIGGKFVTGYQGDYDTVVGLSMRLLVELMNKAVGEESFCL